MLHPMCSIGIETIIGKWLATLLEGVKNKKIKVKFKILLFVYLWVIICVKVGKVIANSPSDDVLEANMLLLVKC